MSSADTTMGKNSPVRIPPPVDLRLPAPVRLFLIISSVCWGLSLATAFWARWVSGASWVQAMRYLFLANPMFDLFCYKAQIHALHSWAHPGSSSPWCYPAPCLLIYSLLYSVSTSTGPDLPVLFLYLALAAAGLAALFVPAVRAMARRGLSPARGWILLILTLLLSWPIGFSLERGNIESLLWVLIAAALLAFMKHHWRTSAVLLGIAAAFKLYPILFFALFLRQRRLRELAMGAVAFAATTLLGLLLLAHTEGYSLLQAIHETSLGVHSFLELYSGRFDPTVTGYDHSLFAVVKLGLQHKPRGVVRCLAVYTPVTGLLGLLLLVPLLKLPRPNQVLALTILTVVMPATSFDYTLQILYVPWAWIILLLLDAQRHRRPFPRGSVALFACMALLMAPETFLVPNDLLYAGALKAAALVAMLVLAFRIPLAETSSGGITQPA